VSNINWKNGNLIHCVFTALTLICVLLDVQSAFALSAKEIMIKNEDARKIQDVTSKAVLTTGGGKSKERVKEFTWWRKLQKDNIRFNTLTRFHFPPEVRGEGILFLEHENDQTDVQIYLPNFKKIRRVESQQQSGSFMGSEFSYSDIATPHVDDYTYKMLKEEDCPEATSIRCAVIETVLIADKVKERTGASRIVSWIRMDNYMSAKSEYFDLAGLLWKKMSASEIKEVDIKLHKWMTHHIKMENVKNNRYTILHFSQAKVNVGISDSIFTPQNLARDK